MKALTIIIFSVFFVGTLTNQGNFKYIYNDKTGCTTVLNKQTGTFAVLCYKDNVNAYYYCKKGYFFIALGYTSKVVYVSKESSTQAWLAKKKSFEDYCEEMVSAKDLKAIYLKYVVVLDSLIITKEHKSNLYEILSSLSSAYKSEKNIFGVMWEISKISFSSKKQDLTPYKSINVDTTTDLQGILWIYKGLQTLFESLGGFEALTKKNITIDTSKLVGDDTGVTILNEYFEKMHKDFDLGQSFKNYFGKQSAFFEFLTQMGGNTFNGYGGFLKALTAIVQYLWGEVSEDNMISTLQGYFTTQDDEKVDLRGKWSSSMEMYKKMFKQYKVDFDFIDVYEALEHITEKKWKLKEVDMTEITEILFKQKGSYCEKRPEKKVLNELKKKYRKQKK